MERTKTRRSITLLEILVTLFAIGLIVGTVLSIKHISGRSAVRETITQLENYKRAAGMFRAKYLALPGDLTSEQARRAGLTPRYDLPGQGNGDGIVQGAINREGVDGAGETAVFWVDLTHPNGMIKDESFYTAASDPASLQGNIVEPYINQYFPPAALGRGNYIYVYNYGERNFYGVSRIETIRDAAHGGGIISSPGITPAEAEQFDQKIDDGLPLSGNVLARYITLEAGSTSPLWAVRTDEADAIPATKEHCYSNNDTPGGKASYNVTAGGSTPICALSFPF